MPPAPPEDPAQPEIIDAVDANKDGSATLEEVRAYHHAIGVPCPREPGAVFQYGPSCHDVLGEVMKRKLAARKQTPLDYLHQRILDPSGVKTGEWGHDTSGNPHIPKLDFTIWTLGGGGLRSAPDRTEGKLPGHCGGKRTRRPTPRVVREIAAAQAPAARARCTARRDSATVSSVTR